MISETIRRRYLPALSEAELTALAARPDALVILPLGAIEQHGPHLPVGTDSLIGSILLDGITAALGPDEPVAIAPPVVVTKSNEHLDFPGTLSISRCLLVETIRGTLDQLREWGFSRVAILNTHGGNLPTVRAFLAERRAAGGIGFQPVLEGGHLACPTPYDQAGSPIPMTAETAVLLNPIPATEMDAREQTFGIHAGEYESSLLYAHVPDLCRPELADTQWIDRDLDGADLRPEDAPAVFTWVSADISPSGTMGDATRATPEKGREWTRRAVEQLVVEIRHLMTS